MDFKPKKIATVRFLSITLVSVITFSALLLHNRGLFHLFDIDYFNFIVVFILLGSLSLLLGSILTFKTIQQFKNSKEILKSSHHSRGIYNNVRNPIYSAVFFISAGLLLIRHNFVLLLVVGSIWLILTLIIIQTEEKRLIKKLGDDYLKYTLRVSRLIPWFSHYFEPQNFNGQDELYLKDAVDFLNEEIKFPVMGISFVSIVKAFWFRKGIFFATEKGIGFYFYGVIRGKFGQIIPYGKISSFVHGQNYFGYFVRLYTSGTSVNLYFIKKGEFNQFIDHVKERVLEHESVE